MVTSYLLRLAAHLCTFHYQTNHMASQRRHSIGFRRGGIVERGVDEIINASTQQHHGLANVDNFSNSVADAMDA
jgi:hypothetical protein